MAATTTLILGGGFGGIAAANLLRQLVPREHDIIVIDKDPNFHVGAGKTWVMLGERTLDQISKPRKTLLDRGIKFLQANILSIGLEGKTVTTESEALHWDYLVIALGADLNLASVPGLAPKDSGLAESAHTFYTLEGAQHLQGAVKEFNGGDIAVLIPKTPFKCPPAPYEAAMLLSHAFEARGLAGKVRIDVYTIEPAPMPTAGPEMGQYIRNELSVRSIGFHPQKKPIQVNSAARRVRFDDGSEVGYDLLIAIPPHEAPKVVRDAKLTNQSGWIPVNPLTLKVTGVPVPAEVYAVGDITSAPLPGRYKPEVALSLPKAGVFAEAHGRVVAHQIAAKILGRESSETFDGRGYCYLEVGGGRAVKADGSFFELPHPVMQKQTPDEAQFRDKLAWVARHLNPIS
jgi:sulfide:quinone oxidoreductase